MYRFIVVVFSFVLLISLVFDQFSLAQDLALLKSFQPDVIKVEPYPEPNGIEPKVQPFGNLPEFGGDATFVSGASRADAVARFELAPSHRYGVTHFHNPKLSENQWLAQRQFEGITTFTGGVRNNTVIPMFGALYRVKITEITAHGAALILTKIPRDEWPPGIELDPYAYPIMHGGSIMAPSQPTISLAVDWVENSEVFRLVINRSAIGATSEASWEVAIGSHFPSGTSGTTSFKVVSIVPPNETTKVVGWVEVRQLWPTIVPFGIDQDIPARE